MFLVQTSLLPNVSRFLHDDWNKLFKGTNRISTSHQSTLPSVNIQENDDSFIVEMSAPGMENEDFYIELNNKVLTIKSQVNEQQL